MTTTDLPLPAARRVRLQPHEQQIVAAALDLFCVSLAVLFAFWAWTVRARALYGSSQPEFGAAFVVAHSAWFFVFGTLWLAAAWLNDFYALDVLADARQAAVRLVPITLLIAAAYFVLYFVSEPNSLPRLVLLYQAAAQFALVGVWRYALARLVQGKTLAQRVLIAGETPTGQLMADAIRRNFDAHYQIVGVVGERADETRSFAGAPVLGTYADLPAVAAAQRISQVVLAVKRELPPALFQALLDLQELGVQITPMPVLFEEITGRVPVDHIGEDWYVALPLLHPGTTGLYPLFKRGLDLIVAIVGLVLFAILLPFLALALKLDSPGPLVYKQTRVGQGGRVFTVYKLRSMVANAEKGQAVWAAKNDRRITRVGRILRKTRLDEFPQFINILRGEMSAVGPRPERPEFVAQLAQAVPFYRLRHAVKPGMAGWAMIHDDYVDSVEDAQARVEYDLYYIKHQSIGLDILILFNTLGQMAKLRGR